MTTADLYLRLSDFRDDDDGFEGRERKLRARAAELDWTVGRLVVENDLTGNGNGRTRPASAFKRKRIVTPGGRTEWRVIRPGFRSVLDDLMAGRAHALLAEDLDRVARDPRDLEDLIDAVAVRGASARSLSGSLTLTDGGTDAEITMARVMVTMGNKASRDTARRVADKRASLAEAGSYGGGKRPYGFRPDPDAPKYRKTLLLVPEEAAVLRAAATDVLDGVPLRAITRDLRARGVPTVSGTAWTPETLRDILSKPSIAGVAVHTSRVKDPDAEDGWRTVRTEHPALWEPILDLDTWRSLRDIFADPDRRTTPGNEPRWLLTGVGRCGFCNDGTSVKVTAAKRSAPTYRCAGPVNHLRRIAPDTDAFVGQVIAARLERPDAADLLRPPVRPDVDAPALRRQRRGLRERLNALSRMFADEEIDEGQLASGTRRAKTKIAKIDAALAQTIGPDPLAEFRECPDAMAVWNGLPLARQRTVVRILATVVLLPSNRRGPGFNPESVGIDWL